MSSLSRALSIFGRAACPDLRTVPTTSVAVAGFFAVRAFRMAKATSGRDPVPPFRVELSLCVSLRGLVTCSLNSTRALMNQKDETNEEAPPITWDIHREGRAWTAEEFRVRAD